MNHSFHPSHSDNTKCAHCKFPEVAHTSNATCEACGNTGNVDLVYGNMLMCLECQDKEKKAHAEAMKPENVQARVTNMNNAMEQSREVDSRIQVRSDIFNAETVAIDEIRKAIASDDSITNKPFALAEAIKARFDHFQTIVFELQAQVVDKQNQQKAQQVYLNGLSNKLRAEEREKLKIADINYQPKQVKPASPKSIKTSKTKLDKAEVKRFAMQLGIGESSLQMLCVAKNISPEVAFNMLKKSIEAGQNIGKE